LILTPPSASGFGIYTGEKWLKFDEAGDKQARELVKNSRTEKGIMITVSGSLVGEQIAVTTIGEYATRKAPQRY